MRGGRRAASFGRSAKQLSRRRGKYRDERGLGVPREPSLVVGLKSAQHATERRARRSSLRPATNDGVIDANHLAAAVEPKGSRIRRRRGRWSRDDISAVKVAKVRQPAGL